jgi:hypothetical protein
MTTGLQARVLDPLARLKPWSSGAKSERAAEKCQTRIGLMLLIRAAAASDVPLLLRFLRELAVRAASERGGGQGRDADQGRLCS